MKKIDYFLRRYGILMVAGMVAGLGIPASAEGNAGGVRVNNGASAVKAVVGVGSANADGASAVGVGSANADGVLAVRAAVGVDNGNVDGVLAVRKAEVKAAEGETPLAGDVNEDGVVDGSDALAECEYIIQLNPSPFDTSLADVNGDGETNVLDATEIVAMYTPDGTTGEGGSTTGTDEGGSVTGSDEGSGVSAVVRRADDEEYRLDLSDIAAQPGDQVTLSISMDNPANSVTSFQMELVLPTGVTVDGSPRLTERAPNTHDIMGNMISTDRYMLICVSTSLKTFTGTSGPLIEVPLKISDYQIEGTYPIYLEDAELVSPRRVDIRVPDAASYLYVDDDYVTSVAGISDGAEQGAARYYAADGRSVDSNYKGLVIEVTDGHARKVLTK